MEDLDIDDILLKTHQTPTIADVDVSLIFNFVKNVLQHPLNVPDLYTTISISLYQTPTIADVDVSLIFNFVKNVLQHPLNCEEEDINTREIREAAIKGNEMLEKLAPIIHKVSSKISTDVPTATDNDVPHIEKVRQTAMSVLRMLSNYSWDAKVVITIAAFALVYSEFGLLVQLNQQQKQKNNNQNPFVISVAVLKQISDLTHPFNTIHGVEFLGFLSQDIGRMLDMTVKIIKVMKLPPKYISTDHPPLSSLMKQVIPRLVRHTIEAALFYTWEIASPKGTMLRDI